MILIADSGSTKTTWCVLDTDREPQLITTKGINPFFQTMQEIEQELAEHLVPLLPSTLFDSLYFYGAGCLPEKTVPVQQALQALLTVSGPLEIHTDMLGAARGLCGQEPGIVGILGTGSNSCFYNGTEITANVSPLGFILGDEGSGAYLGKQLVGNLLKNQLTPGLKEAFLMEYRLTPADIIDRVYRKPFPNRFLASLSPFIAQHLDDPSIYQLVLDGLKAFLQRNVKQYDYTAHPVHFIGSIAFYYQTILEEAARDTGIRLGKIMQSPMEGLIYYHNKKQKKEGK